MKVLIVDRDAGGRQAYMAIARSCGCIALACADVGPNFPVAINGQNLDAIILGHSSETGLAPLRRLREAGIGIRVILITAASVDRTEARILGVEAIFSKPPDVAELRKELISLGESPTRDPDFVGL